MYGIDELVRMNDRESLIPIDEKKAKEAREKVTIRKQANRLTVFHRDKPKIVHTVVRDGLPKEMPADGETDALAMAMMAAPLIEVRRSTDDDGESFHVDSQAGFQRMSAHFNRHDAYVRVARYGVTREEFEECFAPAPDECYKTPDRKFEGEPEWECCYEDTPGGIWISKEPIEIPHPENERPVKFFLYLEMTDMEDACGEKQMHCCIGVVPHWSEMTDQMKKEVTGSCGREQIEEFVQKLAEGDQVQALWLAEMTKSHGNASPLCQASVEWTQEEEDAEDEEGNSTFDRDAKWDLAKQLCRSKMDFEDVAGLMENTVNGLGQDAWSYIYEDPQTFLLKQTNVTETQALVGKMYGMEVVQVPQAEVTTLQHETMRSCPFAIMDPSHYKPNADQVRLDGELPCLCDNEEHRNKVMKKWGYKPKHFEKKGVPLKRSK